MDDLTKIYSIQDTVRGKAALFRIMPMNLFQKFGVIVAMLSGFATSQARAQPNLSWPAPYGDVRVTLSHRGFDPGVDSIGRTGYHGVFNDITDGAGCAGALASETLYGSAGPLSCQAPSVVPIGTPWVQAGAVSNASPKDPPDRIFTDAISSAQMWFSFYVDGTQSSGSVPVNLFYALGAYALGDPVPIGANGQQLSPFAAAEAMIFIRDQYSSLVFSDSIYCNSSCGIPPDLRIANLLLSTNKSYDVSIYTRAYTSNYVFNTNLGNPQIFWGQGYSMAGAVADPYFEIDPTFASAGDYHLVFSEGIANTPLSAPTGIPEPSGWAMLIRDLG